MIDAIVSLLGSRKFIVMVVAQLAIFAPTVFGKLDPQIAAELGVALAGVWMAAHAHEQKGVSEVKASENNSAKGTELSIGDVKVEVKSDESKS